MSRSRRGSIDLDSPRRKASLAGGALIVLFGVWFLGRPDLPASSRLPVVDTSGLEPQVAEKIERFRQRVLEEPVSPESWGQWGMVLQAHGLDQGAQACYQRAAAYASEDFRWPYLLAWTSKHADPREALVEAQRARELRGDYVAAHLLEAQLLEQLNQPEAARKAYERALELEPNAAAELGLGRLYLSRDDLHRSQAHLERAREQQPEAQAVRAFLARLYHRLGNERAAVQEARAAHSSVVDVEWPDPVMDEVREQAVSTSGYQERALRAERRGELDTAEVIYRRLVSLHPEDAILRSNLGNLLFRRGQLPEAEASFRRAVRVDPSYGDAQLGLIAVLVVQGRFVEVRKRLEEDMELKPSHAGLLIDLAEELLSRGNRGEAEYLLQKALEAEPQSTYARGRLRQLERGQ